MLQLARALARVETRNSLNSYIASSSWRDTCCAEASRLIVRTKDLALARLCGEFIFTGSTLIPVGQMLGQGVDTHGNRACIPSVARRNMTNRHSSVAVGARVRCFNFIGPDVTAVALWPRDATLVGVYDTVSDRNGIDGRTAFQ